AMTELAAWDAGREAISSFFAWAWKRYSGLRMVPVSANGQPAFAAYSRSGTDGAWSAHSIQVLSLQGDAIAGLTLFAKPTGPSFFEAFGLPLTFSPDEDSRLSRPTNQ